MRPTARPGRLGALAAVLAAWAVLGSPGPAPTTAGWWFLPEGRVSRAPTPVERRRAAAFILAARAVLARWADPAAAMAAGYEPQSQGEVVHYVDRARLVASGGEPDPTNPSALVFVVGGGAPRLVGAMWMMVAAAAPGLDFGGPLAPWHAHVTCRSTWTVRPIPITARCAPGEVRQVTPEMLHLWKAGQVDPFASDMTTRALICTINSGNVN